MSTGSQSERRLSPRVVVDAGIECRVDFGTRVRLLDYCLSGALLAAELAVPAGVAAQLRTALGASAFRTDVQVKRSPALPAGVPMNGVAAIFTAMDDRSRRSLEDFLRKASE